MAALSVIVVSRHRPMALARCLKGLRQQIDVEFEVVVVADTSAAKAVWAEDLKVSAFDEPNISAARNLGLSRAAGQVVAFIDDDAVPEPTWASRLLAAFQDEDTVAATGYVRGRNGISLQWGALAVDSSALDHPLTVNGEEISWPDPGKDRVVKTQGTNCAFRANALRKIGAFDPNYRFFLDETDVNMRLAGQGRTAIVPLAQVHHGYLESERRRADRVPLTLFEVGASTAVFLRAHAPHDIQGGWARLWDEQHKRLEDHRRSRRIDQQQFNSLMASLKSGWDAGLCRPASVLSPLPAATEPFKALQVVGSHDGIVLHGWVWNLSRLKSEAKTQVDKGKIVTLVVFSPSLRRHRMQYTDDGYWYQSGGIWGKSNRDKPVPWGVNYITRYEELLSEFRRFRPIK